MGADEFEELGMDRAPDGGADGRLRGGAAGERVDVVEARHVFDRDFDAEVEALRFAGVDDRDGAVLHAFAAGLEFFEDFFGCSMTGGFFLLRSGRNASQKMCDFLERPLGGGESDTLNRPSNELFETLERERQMRPSLCRNERVDFV